MALNIDPTFDFTRCILCGCATATPTPVWLDAIRVLHRTARGWVNLTGIASKYNQISAGAHENRRVNFEYGPPKPWRSRHCVSPPRGDFLVLHEQCWQYAKKKLYPSGKPNLKELYEILRELPPSRDPAYSSPSQYHPCREQNLEEFLQGDRELPEPSSSMKEKTSSSSNSNDPFRRLPLEIREKVALLLPSHEFLDLRRVSRAMSTVFHDNFFWKSRFRRDTDHGYLDYIACGVTGLDQSKLQSQNTDWRLFYHASMKIGNKFETTVKVWEVVQWIKDVIVARNGLHATPLSSSGRALQHYHNNSCAAGRRIERAKISPSLVKIGVTMVSSKTVHERDKTRAGWKVFDTETDILAVEFISKEHENITLGTRNKKSKNICPRNLEKAMYAYYRQQNVRNKNKKAAPESPFDGNGVRVLFNAKPEDFNGFRIGYFDEKISSLGVLWKSVAYSYFNQPQAFGFGANDECVFDIGMQMQDIVEVVATFEGRLLVDLGARGY